MRNANYLSDARSVGHHVVDADFDRVGRNIDACSGCDDRFCDRARLGGLRDRAGEGGSRRDLVSAGLPRCHWADSNAGRVDGVHIRSRRRQESERLVEKLLHDDKYTEEYANHWATVWTNLLIGRGGGMDRRDLTNRDGMTKYLRDSFAANKTYDRLVYELVTAEGTTKPGSEGFNGAVNFLIGKVNEEERRFGGQQRVENLPRPAGPVHSVSQPPLSTIGSSKSSGSSTRSSVKPERCDDSSTARETSATPNSSARTLPEKQTILATRWCSTRCETE